MKFKIGDRVICEKIISGNPDIVNKHGIIIGVTKDSQPPICIEFDENVFGHNGYGSIDSYTNTMIKGKPRHCWYVFEDSIRLENNNRRIILR